MSGENVNYPLHDRAGGFATPPGNITTAFSIFSSVVRTVLCNTSLPKEGHQTIFQVAVVALLAYETQQQQLPIRQKANINSTTQYN